MFAKTSDKIEPTISIKLKIKGFETAQVSFDTVPSSMEFSFTLAHLKYYYGKTSFLLIQNFFLSIDAFYDF